ncbi:MAG: DUF4255 domain-containing protein [Aphanizomenon sp.]
MSNYLAIATVTAVLQRIVQNSLQFDVQGARVTTLKPINLSSGPSELGVNIFLYQVLSNPALNNIDATPMRSRANPNKRQTALDLYYMLSFYGNDVELEPQRILGSVLRTLNDQSIITSEMIQQTLANSNFPFLSDSNLGDQVQQINISLNDLSLDDLSKVWSTFFQTPYVLSVVYKVLIVLIDGQEPSQRALPVRRAGFGGVASFPYQPVVEQVVSQLGHLDPILTNSTLQIRGRNFKCDAIKVRIGEVEITPTEVNDKQILLPLQIIPPESLRCGVQSLQVIHHISININSTAENLAVQPPNYHNIESNVFPFVLHPTISPDIIAADIEENSDGSYSAKVIVQVNLTVGIRQRVILALNEMTSENPASYLFEAAKRQSDGNVITIPIDRIKAGEYLLRLIVDGAESQLNIDTREDSPTFNYYISPKLIIY